MTPINIIEEITKPITLTFRLFGNVFAGALHDRRGRGRRRSSSSGKIGGAGRCTVLCSLIWKPFDTLFIGAIQALIFALLTIMYLGMSTSEDH